MKNSNRKLFLFDIDGTLFDNKNNRVSASTLCALKELANVADICIATGRARFMLYSVSELLPLSEYLILINGNFIISKERVIVDEPMDKSLLEKVTKELDEIGVAYGFEGSDDEAISKIDDKVIDSFERLRLNIPPINKDYYKEKNVYQAWCFCDEQIAQLMKKKHPELQFVRWLGEGYDILPQGASKGLGMKKLAAHLQIDLRDVIAFGDGDNDYEMIRDAGIGVAMGNATKKVKAVADYITASVEDDGIFQALKHFGFLK
ncbi:MAG: Cof-type HAD-IIB family hydrolase [Bacilli bacterium]|nr:Cof-type HAD-IIB family hydrolase [Bacilli bacterium]